MTRARLLDLAQLLFGLLILSLVLYNAAGHWNQIEPLLRELDGGWLVAAVIVQLAGFAFLPITSLLAIRIWKPAAGYLSSARAFYLSQLAKYLPGSIWAFPARAMLIKNMGLSLSAASYILLLETAALCASALGVGWLSFTSFPAGLQYLRLPIIGVAGIAGIATLALRQRPRWLFALLPARWRPGEQHAEPIVKSFIAMLVSLSSLAASWVLSGLSFFFILKSIQAAPDWAELAPAISAFSLAWLLGFVVIVSPGGVGVREAALIFLLGGIFGAAEISIAVVLSRLIWSLCELMLYFLFTRAKLGKTPA